MVSWDPLDQSSRNSGNKTRPLMLPNFVTLWQKCVRYLPWKIFAPWKSRPKLQNSGNKSELARLLTTTFLSYSIIVSNFITLGQTMYQESVTNSFLHPSVFWHSEGPTGPKFTNLGPDVQQRPLYQSDKFHPILTTCVWDICCQI